MTHQEAIVTIPDPDQAEAGLPAKTIPSPPAEPYCWTKPCADCVQPVTVRSFRLTTLPGYDFVCPECRRYRLEREDARRFAAQTARDNQAAITRFLDAVPTSFRWVDDDALLRARTCDTALMQASGAVEKTRVVLQGAAGTGKTSLACWMLWQRRYERPLVFISAWDLGKARARHPLGAGDPLEVQTARRAAILILDDLGAERLNRDGDIEDVVYHRHAHGQTTWVTTGFTQDQITDRYGDGIARRLFEGADIIDCGGSP